VHVLSTLTNLRCGCNLFASISLKNRQEMPDFLSFLKAEGHGRHSKEEEPEMAGDIGDRSVITPP
jgi:hypothetical protein